MEHKDYMLLAIKKAKEADAMGEVPVGCVIADAEGTVIASAHNLTEKPADAPAGSR